MQQVPFATKDVLRIQQIGDYTDSNGITACVWPGWTAEPYLNGSLPITYNAEGWAILDILESGNTGVPKDITLREVAPNTKCLLNLTLFKLQGLFSKRYAANIEVLHDGKSFYLGSIAAHSLDKLFLYVRKALAGELKLAVSTAEAVSNAR